MLNNDLLWNWIGLDLYYNMAALHGDGREEFLHSFSNYFCKSRMIIIPLGSYSSDRLVISPHGE